MDIVIAVLVLFATGMALGCVFGVIVEHKIK